MTDYDKVIKLFTDAFDVGVNSERHHWDSAQMRQITCTTMMRELMEIMKGAYPAMMFDEDGDMASTRPLSEIDW